MRLALIGSSGFVGSHIVKAFPDIEVYNSQNIEAIRGKEYDGLIISAPSSNKLLANRNEQLDKKSIDALLDNLRTTKARRVFVVSSVSCLNHEVTTPYGKNRLYFNREIEKQFNNVNIAYYPVIKGEGVRKGYFRDITSDYPLYLLTIEDRSLKRWYRYSNDFDLWIWNKEESEELRRLLKNLGLSPKAFYKEVPESVDVSEIVEEIKTYIETRI